MSETLYTFLKDPEAVLDYTIDWSGWIASGDAITASEWTASNGLTVVEHSFNGSTTTVKVSGGVAGAHFLLTNTITTDDGRIDERTIRLKCEHR